jgi:thiol-disulfide isomerase/thioredoxin
MLRTRLAILVCLLFSSSRSFAVPVEKFPSKFELPGVYKGVLTQDDVKGHFVLMQFWASWCTSCSALMVQMQEFSEEHKAKNLRFVTVSVDEDLASAKSYFEHLPPDFRTLSSFAYFDKAGDFAEKLHVKAIPSVFLLNPSGEIVLQLTGHPNSSQLKELERLLGKQ